MTRRKNSIVAGIVAIAAIPVAFLTINPTATARADSCSDATANATLPVGAAPCADVLAQEARWLTAITAGDHATIESVLSPNYKHIDADGKLYDREQELASTEKLPFTMNPSEQMVDITGNTAVIHGLNTLMQDGQVLSRARFTDVFVLQNGAWLALSAQETSI